MFFACFLIFPLLFIWAVAQQAPCPQSYPRTCKCFPKPKWVRCENLHYIEQFPRDVFSNDTRWLTLEKARFRNVTKEDFEGLLELTELYMTEGYLEYIAPGTFHQLRNLTKVHLSKNFLSSKSFPNATFANLSKLEEVWLDSNGITGLPLDMFVNSPVERLSMANSQLDAFGLRDVGSGQVAKSLKMLFLSGTFLHRFSIEQFSGLTNLERIDLIGCNIHYIHRDFLKGTKVTRLDLMQNPIAKIDADAMRGDQIIDFSCRNCGLTSEKVFGEESFFLQMTSLDRLDLGHNNIDHVPKDAFKGMTKLRTLLLFYNNISIMEENPFDNLSSQLSLGIQNNPFKCDCNLTWFHKYAVQNLRDIIKDIKCATPSKLAGKGFKQLQDSQFCCDATHNTTAICADNVSATVKVTVTATINITFSSTSQPSLSSTPKPTDGVLPLSHSSIWTVISIALLLLM